MASLMLKDNIRDIPIVDVRKNKMRLIGSMTENKIRGDLIAGRNSIFIEGGCLLLLGAIRDIFPSIENAVVLNSIPDQGEDIYELLISEDMVVTLEIPRDGSPYSYETSSRQEYASRHKSKMSQIKMAVAEDLIRNP